MKITVKTIARECNVSPGTVSRVLNNRTNVKEETRRKILSTIKKLQYDPFKNLPLINNIKTRTLGLVLTYTSGDSIHPFDNRAIVTMQQSARRHGYNCLLLSEDEIMQKTQDDFHLGSRNIPCDGLVLFCPRTNWNSYLPVLRNWGIPCVLVRRTTDLGGIAMINDNDYAGELLALEHLYALGHRTIGIFGRGLEPGPQVNARYTAYLDFIVRQRLNQGAPLVYNLDRETASPFPQWFNQVKKHGITAFVTLTDDLAVDLIKRLKALGVRVPEDISVVGYDNDYTARISAPN